MGGGSPYEEKKPVKHYSFPNYINTDKYLL